MIRPVVSRMLAVSMIAALLPMTAAHAQGSATAGSVPSAVRGEGPYVSAPFAAGRTNKPLRAMSHEPSATRVDPGEGLGWGKATRSTQKGTPDPVWQKSAVPTRAGRSGATGESATAGPTIDAAQELTAPLVSFPGQTSPFTPPDPNGDVGPNHYVQMVNSQIQIWNKQGTSLAGPTNINQLWVNGTTAGTGFDQCRTQNAGDPIVLYDQQADRFMISQFTNPNTATGPGGTFPMCIAYSQTGDPTGNWFLYQFNLPRSQDYMKYGIWPDGLYMSTWEGGAVGAYVFDRAQMLSGSPATFQSFSIAAGGGVDGRGRRIVPADWDGANPPPAGAPNPFAMSFDGAFDGGNDRIEIRAFHVDWANPGNTTFTLTDTLDTAAFDTDLGCTPTLRDCIPQRGTTQKVDALSNRLMARLQYRNFGDHQSMVINQTVDGDGNNRAGVRWYELRNTGGGWSIAQQGTYAPIDGVHRWMAAAAMDGAGDIAVGYSASDGTNTFPSLRYTARAAGDPAGSLPQGEQTMTAGTTSQTGSNRWGDYAGLTVDPVDDCTFWLTGMHDNGLTTIGSFRLPSCLQSDLRITKTDAPDPVIAGQDLTYTLTITNDGPATAQSVTVTDALPAGVTLVTAPGCTNAAGTLTCAIGTLLSGQSTVLAVQVKIPSGFLGTATSGIITNTASVTAPNQVDPNPGNNTATATTTVLASADLAVTKLCKPDSTAPAGTEAYCDIHVDNLGPSNAQSVSLKDVLTSATGFNVSGASASPSGSCTVPPQGGPVTSITVSCDLGAIAAGGRTTVRVLVTAADVAEINDVATVSSPTPDPDTANNQATGRVTFAGSADLQVTKSGPATAVAGTPVQYLITVQNNGPSKAVAAVVTDRLPAGVTFVSVSTTAGSCTYGQPTAHDLTCNLGTLDAGAVVTVTVNGTVAPDVAPGTVLVNEAVVSSSTADPNNANNRVSVPTNVSAQADLTVTKADSPDPVLAGNLLTWTITATNAGPSTATSVLLTDTLPAGVSFVSGVNNAGQTVCTLVQTATLDCAVGTLQPGQSATVQVTVRVAASLDPGTVLHNTVTVSSATPDPVANNTASSDTTVATQADVWLDKQATLRSGNPAPVLVYTLVVHNNEGCETDAQSTQTPTCGSGGPSDARDIVVTDALPLTSKKLVVQYVSPQCTYTAATHTVRCTSANVPVGASVTFVIEAQVNGSVGTVLNTASVTSSTPDPTTGNNTNAASVIIKGGTGKK